MNNSIKIALFILFILVAGFLMQHTAVRQFSWNPTFNKYDRQPFGMYVFDDILSTSCPEGYKVLSRGLYEYTLDEDTVLNTSFLLISQSLHNDMSQPDIEYMLEAVSAGNKVMLVSNNLPFQLEDTLGTEVSMPYLYPYDLPRRVTEGMKRDTLLLSGSEFYFYEAFTGATLQPWQKNHFRKKRRSPKKKGSSTSPPIPWWPIHSTSPLHNDTR
ncbi:MAG: DUF4350 domain-containing protein [Bacteroides sp.]|nr:DUF4350 domain-containing protein [Bacteroides sp.]